MRWIAFLCAFATPAFGWDASFSGAVCFLTHETEEVEVIVRHDPGEALPYAIQIRKYEASWEADPLFLMHFAGAAELTISSDRYRLSEDRAVLEVADRGFGNVLAGLALNDVVHAVLGDQRLVIPLDGARAHVEAFQECIGSLKI